MFTNPRSERPRMPRKRGSDAATKPISCSSRTIFFYFAPKLLGCDRTINAVDNFLVCKSQCDRRLIACDRRPINASTLGGRPLSGLTRQGDDRSMVD
jgi:hypothetical protein